VEEGERPELASRPSRPSRAQTGPAAYGPIAFALLWIAAQAVLIVTADRRPDGAFGFRMFSESSTIEVSLLREVAADGETRRVRVEGGAWEARDAAGVVHRHAWGDRVRRPELTIFDQPIHASYGAAAQLARFQAALEHVVAALDHDAETTRLLLDVVVRKNGRAPYVVHLASRARPLGGEGR
jgi:hypothetical protein